MGTGTTATSGGSNSKATGDSRAMEHDSTAEYDTANEYIETMETSKQVWEAPNDFALTSDSTSIRLKSVRRGNPLYQSSALELDDSTGTTATSGGSNSKATGDSRAMEHDSRHGT